MKYHIDRLLEAAVKKRANELRLRSGEPPQLYVDGSFEAVGPSPVTSDTIKGYVQSILSERAQQELAANGAATADFNFGGAARFHVRATWDASGVTLIFRAYSP